MSSNISGDLFTYIPQRKHAKPDRRVIKRQTTLRPFTIKLPSAQQTSQKDSSLKSVDLVLPPVASVHLSPSQQIGQGFQTSTPVRPKEKIPKLGFSPSRSPDFVRVDPCSPPPSSQTEQRKELSLTRGLLRAPEVLETPTSDKKREIQARKLSYFSSTGSSNSLSPVIRNIQQDLTLSVIEDREKNFQPSIISGLADDLYSHTPSISKTTSKTNKSLISSNSLNNNGIDLKDFPKKNELFKQKYIRRASSLKETKVSNKHQDSPETSSVHQENSVVVNRSDRHEEVITKPEQSFKPYWSFPGNLKNHVDEEPSNERLPTRSPQKQSLSLLETVTDSQKSIKRRVTFREESSQRNVKKGLAMPKTPAGHNLKKSHVSIGRQSASLETPLSSLSLLENVTGSQKSNKRGVTFREESSQRNVKKGFAMPKTPAGHNLKKSHVSIGRQSTSLETPLSEDVIKSRPLAKTSQIIPDLRKVTPLLQPLKRKPSRTKQAKSKQRKTSDEQQVSHEPQQTIRFWKGQDERRHVSDVIDLDIVLMTIKEIMEEMKKSTRNERTLGDLCKLEDSVETQFKEMIVKLHQHGLMKRKILEVKKNVTIKSNQLAVITDKRLKIQHKLVEKSKKIPPTSGNKMEKLNSFLVAFQSLLAGSNNPITKELE